MSAPVTEAHRELACTLTGRHYSISEAAELIADSEARACDQLRVEVERLRDGGVQRIKDAMAVVMDERDSFKARAERAEAELANIRVLADRRNKSDHSQDTTHQLVVALDQALDIAQDELGEQKWLKESAVKRAKELTEELSKAKAILASIEEDGTEEHNAAVRLRQELAAERARLDWLNDYANIAWDDQCIGVERGEDGKAFYDDNLRAAIDAAMKKDRA